MSPAQYIQLQYESSTWKRLLAFMTDENIHLKTRLVEMLKAGGSKMHLAKAEGFHNNFITEDELISLLRNDIAEFDRLIMDDLHTTRRMKDEINNKLENIRKHISIVENKFSDLKLEFNNYLLNHV